MSKYFGKKNRKKCFFLVFFMVFVLFFFAFSLFLRLEYGNFECDSASLIYVWRC